MLRTLAALSITKLGFQLLFKNLLKALQTFTEIEVILENVNYE